MAAERVPELRGRSSERALLDRLLEEARSGQSAVLVIRGEAGVGKTALLLHVTQQAQASGFRVARIAGVESQMELAYAGLHQLCTPMLDRLDALPEPQHVALRVALGLSSGDPPDRFLVALATLGLVSAMAEEHRLLCVVDDLQWLDEATARALEFVARRLLAEPVALVFAVREPSGERQLVGLPDLPLRGLEDVDARALLETVIPGPIDERVRDRIVAETRGNPLALLELPRGRSPAELAGGLPSPLRVGCPAASRTVFADGSTRCRPTPGGCCSLRRPIRWPSPCSCGGPRSSSGLIRRPRRRRLTPGCSRSARRFGSVTR
jgi:AAA ATPase domain